MNRKLFFLVTAIGSVVWQGCEKETLPGPADCDSNPVFVEVISVQDADCASANGSIEVAASGGSGTYRYKMDNKSPQNDPIFTGTPAGVFSITALDENDCAATIDVTVKNKSGLDLTVEATNAGCMTANSTLTVNGVGGTPPYQYKLGDGAFSATNTFAALSAGQYSLVVEDATGCKVNQKVHIKSGISYSGSIAGIIEANCAVSGCHNGTQAPDFRTFKNVQDNAAQIKLLTGNKTMPQNGTLSQEQINMIACWVDDGAPQN